MRVMKIRFSDLSLRLKMFLAPQAAKATEEITGQVAAMQQATGEAVAAIGHIGATIGEISQIATTIVAAADVLKAATWLSEQSDALRRQVDRFLAEVKAA